MDSSTHPSRRHVIAGAGAGLGTIALAACGSGGEDSGGAAPSSTSEGSSPASTQPAEGSSLATLSDIKVGEAVRVTSDGKDIVVARPTEDSAVAFSAICTHKGCKVDPKGKELTCPCHGSRFNSTTGKVLGGPADSALPSVDVRVEDGKVVAGPAK